MDKKTFKWTLGSPPPKLESHSEAKLRLVRQYLHRYFARVAVAPGMEELNISLVDGFCGGGAFRWRKGEIMPGTPIIMLESVRDAENQLNLKFRKNLTINAKYFFIDKEKSNTDYLTNEIKNTDFASLVVDGSIHVTHGRFEKEYKKIIQKIRLGASAGRSIFLLDQCGYGDVPLSICREILEQLRGSEIILTFAIDWLIRFISDKPKFHKAVRPLGIGKEQIKELLEAKKDWNYRSVIQKILAKCLQHETGAAFFTPFFLRSQRAHSDLWVVHLSKHPAARNEMVSGHWDIQNASIHQGRGGLDMLGFRPDSENLSFDFDDRAESLTLESLQVDIPHHMEESVGLKEMGYYDFQCDIANKTPARLDQIDKTLHNLHGHKDIEIWTPGGKRKKPGAKLEKTDILRIAQNKIFIFPK